MRFASFFPVDYYDSNKSTGKETGKTHLCAVYKMAENLALQLFQSLTAVT